MSEKLMMKCGHTAQGHRDSDKSPVCVICDCSEIADDRIDLTGRTARCTCGKTKPSDFGLAFFEYHPKEACDRYYCGCYGWD